MFIDCGGDGDYDDYDDDDDGNPFGDEIDIIEYELDDEGYDGTYLAGLIICPHCNSLSANLWPVPLAALQCDDCGQWLPTYALGWIVDELREELCQD